MRFSADFPCGIPRGRNAEFPLSARLYIGAETENIPQAENCPPEPSSSQFCDHFLNSQVGNSIHPRKKTKPQPPQKMKITFRHQFSSGHRAICSLRGPRYAPKITFPKGLPPRHVVDAEYGDWISDCMQTAADRFKTNIAYCIPREGGVTMAIFQPSPAN